MTNAVVERTDATTETKAEGVVETKDEVTNLVTDDGAKTEQTETDAENETTKATEVDHAAELEREADEARKAVIRQELEEENRVKDAEAKKAADTKARKDKQHATFDTNIKAADKLLDNIDAAFTRFGVTTADGQPAIADRAAFKGLIESLNLVAAENAEEQKAEEYRAAIDSHIPEKDREAFWKEREAADSELSLSGVIDALVELKAPSAKAVKNMTLDQFKAASPKGWQEHADQLGEYYQAGIKGREMGLGAQKASDGTATGRELTYADFVKLPETEKQAFIKRSPGKFNALLGIK